MKNTNNLKVIINQLEAYKEEKKELEKRLGFIDRAIKNLKKYLTRTENMG